MSTSAESGASQPSPGQPAEADGAPSFPAANPWILNARLDLVFFVATPLLIIPLIVILQGYLSAPDIYLYVISFGALGHHLPGLLRAYGDRQLFSRFRVRFIVAPLFLLVVCSFFAHRNLNGLLVMTLIWGIWHGMAQVYGFLRIYDAKAKSFSPLTARLDMAMCIAWFGLGLVQSPDRMSMMLSAFYDSGGPLIPASTVHWLQSTWTVATACVSAGFVANLIWQSRQGRRPSPVKLLLMVTSFGFWWYAMTGIKHVILGIAMFEIFHDVQYLAIVWIYNVKRATTARDVGAFTHFLFRRSWSLVGLYVGLVFAYGYINLFTASIDTEFAKLTMFGLVTASGFLHFYYDGFIWKVREKSTREGLGLAGGQSEQASMTLLPPWLVHGLKWSLFVVPAALLATAELRGVAPDLERQRAIVQAVPNSPNANNDLGLALEREGRFDDAITHFRRTLELNPGHGRAHCNLGNSLQALGRFDEAVLHWQQALRLEPNLGGVHNSWGKALLDRGQVEGAVAHWHEALQLDPDLVAAHFNLGNILMEMGQFEEAAAHWKKTVRIEPRNADAQHNLGNVLQNMGRFKEAETHWQAALQINPDLAQAHNNWGNALQSEQRFEDAMTHYEQALEIDPDYAEAQYNLGNALHQLQRLGEAALHYEQALRINPNYVQAHNNLGLTLVLRGRFKKAAEHFQHAVRLDPNNQAAYGNLQRIQGILQQNNPAQP